MSWQHVRRKFVEVIKAGGKKKKGSKHGTAQNVIDLIAKLYGSWKNKPKSKSLIQSRLNKCVKSRPSRSWTRSRPSSTTGMKPPRPRACWAGPSAYALGQWERVEPTLNFGILRPNNLAENAIRPALPGQPPDPGQHMLSAAPAFSRSGGGGISASAGCPWSPYAGWPFIFAAWRFIWPGWNSWAF